MSVKSVTSVLSVSSVVNKQFIHPAHLIAPGASKRHESRGNPEHAGESKWKASSLLVMNQFNLPLSPNKTLFGLSGRLNKTNYTSSALDKSPSLFRTGVSRSCSFTQVRAVSNSEGVLMLKASMRSSSLHWKAWVSG